MGQAAIQQDADLNQPDAGAEEVVEERQQPKSLAMSRLEEMERISAARLSNKDVADEFVDIEGKPAKFDTEPVAEEQDEEAPEEEPAEQETKAEQPAKAPAVEVVKVKIDGEEMEMPLSEVLAGYQKNEAASRRLTEAARRMQEVEARERALAEREAGIKSAAPAATADVEAPSIQKDEGFTKAAKEFIETLYGSNDEDAAEKLAALLDLRRQPGQAPQPATIDLEQIQAQLAPRIRQQFEVDSALQQFAEEFPEIAKDPYLESRSNAFLAEIVESGTKSPLEALRQAGTKTRDWLKQITGATPAQPSATTTQPDRLSRKQNLDRVRPASAVQSAAPEIPEESPQMRSSVIAEMARARGKPI